MKKHIVPVLLGTILILGLSPLAAQYNPAYRVLERLQYEGIPGGVLTEGYYYQYSDSDASVPCYIHDAVSYGTDQFVTIEFNDLGLKQDLRFFNENSQGNTGYLYHLDYDAANRPISAFTYLYNPAPYPMIPQSRNYYSYTDDRLTMISRWEHFSPSNPRYYKSVFNYDDNGNPVEELRYTGPDSVFADYDLGARRVWTYDAGRQGDLMALLDGWAEENYIHLVTALHPTHQPTTEIFQQLFYPDWLNREKREYSYDDQNRLIQLETYTFYGGNWILAKTETFTYAEDGNLLYHYGNMSGWVDVYEWQLRTPVSSETPELSPVSLELSVYPQPFSEQVNLSIKSNDAAPAKLEIFNIKGQLLRSWIVQPGETLLWDGNDARGQSCGSAIYLVRVEQAGSIASKKMIRTK